MLIENGVEAVLKHPGLARNPEPTGRRKGYLVDALCSLPGTGPGVMY